MTSDTLAVAERGRREAEEALRLRGATVRRVQEGNLHWLMARPAPRVAEVRLRVKTRTTGTWQDDIRHGNPCAAPADPPCFWIFVDLSTPRATFYIVPDAWMRRDIDKAHQEYLARHGGQRAETQDSTHHAIQLSRIADWRDRWDQLQLAIEA